MPVKSLSPGPMSNECNAQTNCSIPMNVHHSRPDPRTDNQHLSEASIPDLLFENLDTPYIVELQHPNCLEAKSLTTA